MINKNTLFAEDISFSFITNGNRLSWQDFNFKIKQGEIVSIIGSSGIGKTTLLRVLSGLHNCESGKVYIDDPINIVQQPDSPIFIVFQEYNLTLLPWLTIEDNINLGLHKSSDHEKPEINKTLNILFSNNVDFNKLLKSYPDQLSGGQKQRIQIARALISDSKFIFFDEPDTGIDYKNKLNLRKTIRLLATDQEKGIVLITHDLENAFELSDRFYLIHKINGIGKIELIELNKSNFLDIDIFREKVLNYI